MSAKSITHVPSNSSGGPNDYSEKAIENRIEQETINSEDNIPARGGFLQKTKRHCARFWWLHIIIFCIIFLIIALCLVYVGMPRIAQDGVNDSTVTITDLQFREPTPESLFLEQSVEIKSPSMYTPRLDAFPVTTYLVTNGTYRTEPMLDIPLPSIHIRHDVNATSAGSVCKITSQVAVADYCIAVLTQEEVTSALVGKTDLHLGHLPTVGIKYNKTTTYKGLNGLKGFNVTDVKLNATETRANVPNLEGIAFIPNPSALTVELGNVTLTLSTKKAGLVGIATILEMTIRPGDNNLPLTAVMNQTGVLSSLDTSTGLVSLEILGESSVRNGVHLPYYETALKVTPLNLDMNVAQILKDSA